MSRVSKATVDKRHILSMIGREGMRDFTDPSERGVGGAAIPDGAFPALLHTCCLVEYDLFDQPDGAPAEPDVKAPSTTRGGNTARMTARSTRSARAGETSLIASHVLSSDRLDDYDRELDQNAARGAASVMDPDEDEATHMELKLENKSSRRTVSEVWCGEPDGSISIRCPLTGRHLPRHNCHIFPNTFVQCMIQVRDYVFAGYQDGNVRAFHVQSKALWFEKKKHAGSVNALAQWNNNVVFSASDDFRIIMWKVGTTESPDRRLKIRQREKLMANGFPVREVEQVKEPEPPSFLHHFAGHTNHVHALWVEGDYLFSGADDGLVRCWDLYQRSEVQSQYPLLAHTDGVKDLIICEDVLFTAGKGGVALWSMETCAPLHRFVLPEVNHIAMNPASLTLWACCSTNGTITVYDLFTFQEIGQLDDFNDANIKKIAATTTSAASRLFLTLPGNGYVIVYSENSPTGMRALSTTQSEQLRIQYESLDLLREQVLAAHKIYLDQRSLLHMIVRSDQRRKRMLAQYMDESHKKVLKARYVQRALEYVVQTRHADCQAAVAGRMLQDCQRRLISSALIKWKQACQLSRDSFFRQFVTKSLTNATNLDLLGKHLTNALQYLFNVEDAHRWKRVSNVLSAKRRAILAQDRYLTWIRFVTHCVRSRQRKLLIRSMCGQNNVYHARKIYNILYRFSVLGQRRQLRRNGSLMMMHTCEMGIMWTYWTKLKAYTRGRGFARERQRSGQASARCILQDLARRYYGKLRSYMEKRKLKAMTDSIEELNKGTETMRYLIATDDPSVDVADLDRQIAELTHVVDQTDIEVEVHRIAARCAATEERLLMIEANQSPSEAVARKALPPGDEDYGISERWDAALTRLRRFANCENEADGIIALCKIKGPKLPVAFNNTLDKLRDLMEPYAVDGSLSLTFPWKVDKEAIKQAPVADLKKAAALARRLAVAWDHIKTRRPKEASDLSSVRAGEVAMNVDTIEYLLACERNAVESAAKLEVRKKRKRSKSRTLTRSASPRRRSVSSKRGSARRRSLSSKKGGVRKRSLSKKKTGTVRKRSTSGKKAGTVRKRSTSAKRPGTVVKRSATVTKRTSTSTAARGRPTSARVGLSSRTAVSGTRSTVRTPGTTTRARSTSARSSAASASAARRRSTSASAHSSASASRRHTPGRGSTTQPSSRATGARASTATTTRGRKLSPKRVATKGTAKRTRTVSAKPKKKVVRKRSVSKTKKKVVKRRTSTSPKRRRSRSRSKSPIVKKKRVVRKKVVAAA